MQTGTTTALSMRHPPSCCRNQNPVCGLYRRGDGGHNNPKSRGAIPCGRLLDNLSFTSMQTLTIAAACRYFATIAWTCLIDEAGYFRSLNRSLTASLHAGELHTQPMF